MADTSKEIKWNEASFEHLLQRQEMLRAKDRGTTPLIPTANYPELRDIRVQLTNIGFDTGFNDGGLITVLVEDENQFKSLQEFATRIKKKIEMTEP